MIVCNKNYTNLMIRFVKTYTNQRINRRNSQCIIHNAQSRNGELGMLNFVGARIATQSVGSAPGLRNGNNIEC